MLTHLHKCISLQYCVVVGSFQYVKPEVMPKDHKQHEKYLKLKKLTRRDINQNG